MKIESVEPQDLEYEEVTKAVRQKRRNKIDYEALQRRYNELAVRGYLILEVDKSLKVGNVVVVMANRGLVRSIDYEIIKLRRNSKGQWISAQQRPLVITKLSARPMQSK